MKSLLATIAILLVVPFAVHAQTTTVEDTHVIRAEKDSAGAKVIDTHTVTRVDEVVPRENMIVVNPLKFFLFYNIGYMHKLTEHFAVGGSIQTPTLSGLKGFGANIEGRFYPGTHNLRGFYVAPNFSFNSVSYDDTYYTYDGSGNSTSSTSSINSTATSIGVLMGWQWFPGDDFAIGLGIGIDNYWLSGDNKNITSGSISSLNGLVPAFRLDIGYGW